MVFDNNFFNQGNGTHLRGPPNFNVLSISDMKLYNCDNKKRAHKNLNLIIPCSFIVSPIYTRVHQFLKLWEDYISVKGRG